MRKRLWPSDLVRSSAVSRPPRGVWVALAAAVAVTAVLIPVVLLTGAPQATEQTPPVQSTGVGKGSTTTLGTEPNVLARFDVVSFAASKLGGAFDDFEDRVGVVVLIPSDAESRVEALLSERNLPELEGYSYVPVGVLSAAAERFAENWSQQPLEDQWIAYGLIPQFDDSPTDDWGATLRSIPDSVVVRVDFKVPVDHLPEGWTIVGDLPSNIASGAVVEAVDTGIVVIQPGSTLLVGFDGSLTSGEQPPLPMTASCCGGEDGLRMGNDLLLIDEGRTETWLLETDTMIWRPAGSRRSAGYVLGSAFIGDQLFIVTAATRTGEPRSSVTALNVSTLAWHELESVPAPISVGGVTTDGERLIVAGTHQGPNNNIKGSRNPVAYEYTATDGWSQLPDIPIDGQASTITWVNGAGLLAWNYDLESALLKASSSWTGLGRVPMDSMECYPQSTSTAGGAAGFCGGIAWFDAETGTWASIRHSFDTRYVVSDDAIFGLMQVGRDQVRLIQYPLPPPR